MLSHLNSQLCFELKFPLNNNINIASSFFHLIYITAFTFGNIFKNKNLFKIMNFISLFVSIISPIRFDKS